jgi:hypothetical protein
LLNPAGTIVPCTDANLAIPNVQIAPPLYSAWLLSPADNTFKPVVPPTEGIMVTDIVTLQARTPPAYIPPIGTSTLTGDAVGVIDIRSIYDWADAINPQAIAPETNAQTIARMSNTPADSRRVRFMRLENRVFGRPAAQRWLISIPLSPWTIHCATCVRSWDTCRSRSTARCASRSRPRRLFISILDARAHRLADSRSTTCRRGRAK